MGSPQFELEDYVVFGVTTVVLALLWLASYSMLRIKKEGVRDPIGRISRGSVERRQNKELSWDSIGTSEDLFLLDTIFAPPGESVEIELAGREKISLEPESMVRFDAISNNRIHLTLEFGKVKSTEKAKISIQPRRTIIVPKWTSMARLPSLQHLEDRLKQWLAVTSLGAPSLENIEQVETPKFDLSSVLDFELQTTSPANGATLQLKKGDAITLAWSMLPVPNATYLVEFSRDAEFKQSITTKAKANTLPIKLTNGGTYYWRVRGTAKLQTQSSAGSSFDIQFY